MKSVLTTCPFCACGCALYLEAPAGRTFGVAPSEHHPVSQGSLCARGWNAHEAPAWGERLTVPLVRRHGILEPASWEDAIAQACRGLAAAAGGGKGVGVLGSARATNEENYLAARLARGALNSGRVDSCLRASYQPLVDGIAAVLGTGPTARFSDVEASDALLVLEGDLAATHPQAARAVIRALHGGATLAVIGSTRTQLARLATLHLPSRPGERQTVLAELAAELLRERGTAPLPGIDELRQSLAALSGGDDVRRAAEWLARAARVTVLIAPEAGTPRHAAEEGGAVATLAAVAARPGRESWALLVLAARGNLRGACEMGLAPDRLPGGLGLDDGSALGRLARAWGRPPAATAGPPAAEIVAEAGGLVVVAEDPPAVLPAGHTALAALSAAECLVVLDAFATATARAASVVLPIASFAEAQGTVTSAEGRVQRVRPACQAPGEARPGWQVLAELSAAMGLSQPYGSAADVLREIGTVVPAYGDVREGVAAEPWGTFVAPGEPRQQVLRRLPGARSAVAAPAVLAVDGVFDWGSDPLVSSSPTLSRDHLSRRKLYPRGLVEMCRADAQALGLREGWAVRLTSEHGEVVLPTVVSDGLLPGVLLVPYAFRDAVAAVMAGGSEVPVRAEKAQ